MKYNELKAIMKDLRANKPSCRVVFDIPKQSIKVINKGAVKWVSVSDRVSTPTQWSDQFSPDGLVKHFDYVSPNVCG